LRSLARPFVLAFAVLSVSGFIARAQGPSKAPTPRSVVPEMVDFLTGRWSCQGKFATGKPIAATKEFHETLNGAWLAETHDDTPPSSYHAMTMWGTPRSGGFVAHIADNGGGMRRFVSAGGWKHDTITITRDTTLETPQFKGHYAEHFVYTHESATTFRMTYETQAGENPAWHMGDTMLCTKQ
jgi:hypothetical protein